MRLASLRKLTLPVLAAAVAGSGLALPAFAGAAEPDPAPNWRLVDTTYPTVDTVVAAYSVRDFGATGDGTTDVTAIFQKLLDSLGRLGGGTLFVPEGRYALRGTLVIPKGVTLRGEWRRPEKGQPIQGTILMAYAGRGSEDGAPFITMEPSSGVRDLAFWYPEQQPDAIVAYPPTVLFGKPNYWGNDFCNASNLTLVNAYSGVIFSRETGGASPVVNGIYGTPLSRGIEIDNIADVGRIERIGFSPDYWSGSGLAGAPAPDSAFEAWIRERGTGIVMRRNDWSYTSFVTVEGYNKGFLAAPSIPSPGSAPNGHNYGFNFIDCETGIDFEAGSGVGIMFTNVRISGAKTGIAVEPGVEGAVQLNGLDVSATERAIAAAPTSKANVFVSGSRIGQGAVDIEGGAFVVSDSDFANAAPQIRIGEEARSSIVGNRFAETAQLDNRSRYVSAIDPTPAEAMKLPNFPAIEPQPHKPARSALYVATAAPFGAKGDGTRDDTKAIQAALDRAKADGGGVVFLPPGKYKALGRLTVPTGVELKGANDNGTVPMGPGSILEVYAGKGEAGGEPFLKLEANSGVRGVVFDYPEQTADLLPNVVPYPYTMQALGSGVYIVNVGLRAAYDGIDLFTYRADNHDVDFAAGHVFHNGVRAGGGATDGRIYNLQFNPIVYASGGESKFGSWPNSPKKDGKPVYDYGYDHLDFLVLGDVRGETLYNDFLYGSNRGITLAAENGRGPSGISLGLGVDGSKVAMAIEAIGDEGFPFINTQLVSIGDSPDTRYVKAGADFGGEASFYGADLWGSPVYGLDIGSGKLNLQLAYAQNPGKDGFSRLGDNGSLRLETSGVGSTKALLNRGAEPRLAVRSSIADAVGIAWKTAAAWQFNLSNYAIEAAVPAPSESPAAPPVESLSAAAASPAAAPAPAGEAAAPRSSLAGSAALWIGLGVLAAAAAAILVVQARKKNKNVP